MMSRFNYLLACLLFAQPLVFSETTPATPKEETAKQDAIETTLAIIKPDAVKNNHIGDVIALYEKEGLRIAGIKMGTLSREEVSEFYRAHKNRPFYDDLVSFISSGPVVILAVQGKNAIAKNREIMGSTDPKNASKGSIRAAYGESITKNAVHGSDSPASAKDELYFFFDSEEISQRF